MVERLRSTNRYTVIRIVSLVVGLGIWQLVSTRNGVLVPPPTEVLADLFHKVADGSIFVDVEISLQRVLIAFVIGTVSGSLLGLFMGTNRIVESICDPIVELVRPIPPLGWIPFAMLTMGIEEVSKEYIIWLGVFFPVLLSTFAGVRAIDPNLIKAARSLGARSQQVFFKIVLPACIPAILTGTRVGLGVGWTCLVAAELIAAKSGVGYLIMRSYHFANYGTMMVGMIVIGVLGVLLELILRGLDNRLTFWVER